MDDQKLKPIASVEDIWLIYDNMNAHPFIFSDLEKNRPDLFYQRMTRPDMICLKNHTAYVLFEHIRPGMNCDFHGADFGGEPLKYLDEVKEHIKAVFEEFHLTRMTARIPEMAKKAIGFLDGAGFQHEGTVRQAYRLNGEDKDLLIYGLLRGEL